MEFLEDSDVADFINYMTMVITGKIRMVSSYYHAQARMDFNFGSLSDAYNNYWYRTRSLDNLTITSFHDSKVVLDSIKKRLRIATDESSASRAAKDLMKWGGTFRGNSKEIDAMGDSGGFLRYISSAKAYFGSANPDREIFNKLQIRSNAGFTKIHSLIMDDFIIYDSRVAAALGMLIVKFCVDKEIGSIPKSLELCWLSGTMGKHLRNPSFPQRYIFPEFNPRGKKTETEKIRYHTQHFMHAESNCKANWILVKALEKAGEFSGFEGQEALRAVEAALFTVGYDLAETYKR